MPRSALTAMALMGAATSALGQELSAGELASRAIARRAVKAVIWGMPAVNYDLMYQEMLKLGGKPNQIVYWSRLPNWRNQTLTANPDVISEIRVALTAYQSSAKTAPYSSSVIRAKSYRG
jgi:hypothetical protein